MVLAMLTGEDLPLDRWSASRQPIEMRTVAVMALAALAGCSMPRASRAALGANLAALACDWSQTRSWAELGWHRPERERNPLLGPTPSTEAVDVYFLGAAAALVAAWHVLPERYRLIGLAGLGIAQARTIRINAAAIEARDEGRRGSCAQIVPVTPRR